MPPRLRSTLRRSLGLALCVGVLAAPARAEDETLDFASYLDRVARHGVVAAAARAEIPVAEARIAVARAFRDPSLVVGLQQVDISGEGAPTASFVGVTVPIELGRVRAHRVAVAEAGVAVAEAELELALRSLRLAAALAYVDALEAQLALSLRRESLEALERLVAADRRRFEAGELGEGAFLRSQLEADRFRVEWLAAEGRLRANTAALGAYLGGGSSVVPTGELVVVPAAYEEASLVAGALETHPAVVARDRAVAMASRSLSLARRERIIDLELEVGWTHNGSTEVEQFRQNANDLLGATLRLPLPFANRHRGGLRVASAIRERDAVRLEAERIAVTTDVRRALADYQAAVARLAVFDQGLLARADAVRERIVYEYEHDATTLLAVLDAQRATLEVRIAHLAALADHARALLRLQAAAGLAPIGF